MEKLIEGYIFIEIYYVHVRKCHVKPIIKLPFFFTQ